MYIRTTTLGTSNMMTSYLLSAESKYNQLAEEASSGKKVTKPSDDSSAAVNILNTNKKLNQLSGYTDNMKLAQNELDVLDNTLASTTDQLEKANDLAVQAANGTCSQDELNNIKIQIDQILGNVQDLANTQYNGNYIFSGTKTATPAYQTDASGNIVYNGTPKTGAYQRYVQIADGVNETVNTTGDQVFGYYKLADSTPTNPNPKTVTTNPSDVEGTTFTKSTDADGNPITVITAVTIDKAKNETTTTVTNASGILGDLKMLSNALGKGDNTQIRASLDSLTNDQNTVSVVRTSFASVSQRFDMTISSNNNMTTQLKEYRSSLQDADLAEVLTNLATQQTALQASMSVTSKILGMSLLDYM